MPSLTSLTKSLLNTVSQQSNDCYLIELDEEGRPKTPLSPDAGTSELDAGEQAVSLVAFQYFPETVSDTKAINYQTKDIPGASLPLYQWVNGGERTISFTAMFTCDVDLLTDNAPGGIAASLSGASGTINDRLKNSGVSRRNPDIRGAIGMLRRFMYPEYVNVAKGKPLTVAPPKLRLVMPGSGIGTSGGSTSSADSVRCIMTQCDVTYEAFFPSGLPRIVSIQLAFAEIPQFGGFVEFPRRQNIIDRMVNNGSQYLGFTPRIKGVGGSGQGGTGNF